MDQNKIDMLEKAAPAETGNEKSVRKFLSEYIIPEGKLPAMDEWLRKMRAKNPGMKTDRLLRKAAEYFRLQKIVLISNT